ncbi:MAG: hypothetical protein KBI07_03830 [Candidatus Atribacteria bacterium]|nr:hypothetical protein [Candidatus Atribacteria bacterium]
MNTLYITFLWHFHQPIYKDFSQNKYLLPWVRLHLTKEYYMMAKLIEENEKVKVTFNFTPSLVEQTLDYVNEEAYDLYLDLSSKKADLLTTEEKFFILERFFRANWEKVIYKNPRYAGLLRKRGYKFDRVEDARALTSFSTQDFRDLQTLFELSWISEYALEEDQELKRIKEKERNYTEEEKLLVLEKEKELIKKILPLYRELFKEERIEISTSPYAHPIMPLIINTDIARKCQDTPLPVPPFSRPEDLDEQIKWGKGLVEEYMGGNISGLWPPEGGVSPEILPFLTKHGFEWLATDETIFYRSKRVENRKELYKPYFIQEQDKKIKVIFRDRTISDLIGFTYGKMETDEAVKDLVVRIKHIQNSLDSPGILPIILDGENPWEFYPESGISFLREVYRVLPEEEGLVLTTVSEALKCLSEEELTTIAVGSWINGDFRVWIGDKEDNISWDYLRKVRDDFENFSEEEKKKVKKIMFAAEGSDWNWWYGSKPLTTTNTEFDLICRTHLMSIYSLLHKEIPSYLWDSIIAKEEGVIIIEPCGMVKPEIDGRYTTYFEWLNAGTLKGETSNGTMVIIEPVIDFIKFGFDEEKLFFLLKFTPSADLFEEFKVRINLEGENNNKCALLFSKKNGDFKLEEPLDLPVDWKFFEVLEIGFPFLPAGFEKGEKIFSDILFVFEGKPIAKLPGRGRFSFTLPEEDYVYKNWFV